MLLSFTLAFLAAADWTRFRGPNGSGIAGPAAPPVRFDAQTAVVWKTPLPPGHSSPVLTRTHIFVTAVEGETLLTIALDRATGRVLWKREAPRPRKDRLQNVNGPASPSPVTDGSNVYVYFQDYGLISYNAAGRVRWQLPLGSFRIQYGFGASPILVDGDVVLPVDQDLGSFLLAVNKNTGRVRWKVERPGVISGYSTPVLYQPKTGGKQILIAESFQLSAYSARTGERVWQVRGLACEMKSVPVIGDGVLYINGWGFAENQPGRQLPLPTMEEADANKDGVIAAAEMPHQRLKHPAYFGTFDIDGNGTLNRAEWEIARAMMASENGLLAIDLEAKTIRWRYQKPVPQVPSPLLYGGAVFLVNDSGILLSFDPATGNVIRQGRLKGAIDKYFASPIGAGGKVWLISQDGTVSVVSARGEWEVEQVNSLGDEVFATPAIEGGRMYVRTKNALYCFGGK